MALVLIMRQKKREIFAGRQNSRQTLPSARWDLEVDPQGIFIVVEPGYIPVYIEL